MDTLRSRLIHLAHANPELRPRVLPLLVKTAGGNPDLIKMEKDLLAAQKSVNKAVALLKKVPANPAGNDDVISQALLDLSKMQKLLKELVGPVSPYVWDVINLDKA